MGDFFSIHHKLRLKVLINLPIPSLWSLYETRFHGQLALLIHIPQQDMTRPYNDNKVCLQLKPLILHQFLHIRALDIII